MVVAVLVMLALVRQGQSQELRVAIALGTMVPTLAIFAWLLLAKRAKGQLVLTEHELVLTAPLTRPRRVALPIRSITFHTWSEEDALGAGVRGDRGIIATVEGTRGKVRLGGRGVHAWKQRPVERRAIDAGPTAELKGGHFRQLLGLLEARVEHAAG
ncbi:MAG: hypothetical protein R2939_05980 [Kofleriaceae bacterium]